MPVHNNAQASVLFLYTWDTSLLDKRNFDTIAIINVKEYVHNILNKGSKKISESESWNLNYSVKLDTNIPRQISVIIWQIQEKHTRPVRVKNWQSGNSSLTADNKILIPLMIINLHTSPNLDSSLSNSAGECFLHIIPIAFLFLFIIFSFLGNLNNR